MREDTDGGVEMGLEKTGSRFLPSQDLERNGLQFQDTLLSVRKQAKQRGFPLEVSDV